MAQKESKEKIKCEVRWMPDCSTVLEQERKRAVGALATYLRAYHFLVAANDTVIASVGMATSLIVIIGWAQDLFLPLTACSPCNKKMIVCIAGLLYSRW